MLGLGRSASTLSHPLGVGRKRFVNNKLTTIFSLVEERTWDMISFIEEEQPSVAIATLE